MTKKEAIERLKKQRDWAWEVDRLLDVEAFNIAIKTLDDFDTLIRIKELEEMYEMFKKKIWVRHEDVCGDEMIELNSAEEVLFNLLSELGCWNEEKIYKEGNN